MSVREFEIGPIRPPSEGGSHSLLLRFTRNCPWNKCTFCFGLHYGRQKFQLRSLGEIKADIKKARAITDLIKQTSEKLGFKGAVNPEVANALFNNDETLKFSPSFMTVLNWLDYGGRTVFLQDADSLIMRTTDLVEAIQYLKKNFPFITRITSYGRSKSALHKSLDELKSLKRAGLTRLHVGLETGDDELLEKVHKGVTAEQHIKAGKKIVAAGIELSEYIMPGLGGKEMTEQHARNTALVLNAINPDYIRSRPLAPKPGTPLTELYYRGDFLLLSPHEMLRELKLLLSELTVSSKLSFDHVLNPCIKSRLGYRPLFDQDYEGYQLPDEKEHLLAIIEKSLTIDETEFVDIEEIARTAI